MGGKSSRSPLGANWKDIRSACVSIAPVNRKKVSSPLTASTIMSSPGSLTSACPRDLSGIEATSWRASFIIGWTCAHLMIDAWDEEGHVDNLFVPQIS